MSRPGTAPSLVPTSPWPDPEDAGPKSGVQVRAGWEAQGADGAAEVFLALNRNPTDEGGAGDSDYAESGKPVMAAGHPTKSPTR